MSDLEFIDHLQACLKTLKADIKKKNRLRERTAGSDLTRSQSAKLGTELNWLCMNIEKEKTEIARLLEGSMFDIETGEKTYRPSGWHEYKY